MALAPARGARVHLLGSDLDVVDMREAVARCEAAIAEGSYLQHMSINAAKLVSMQTDRELADGVNSCGLITADGQSVVWAARLLGVPLPERVAGIDLMQEMLAVAEERGYGVYLLGAKAAVLERAIENLLARYPRLRIAGAQHGYFAEDETEAVADAIRDADAQLLFVAMSSPRKEHFLGRLGPSLGVPFAMGVGGSVDVIAGVTRRAPVWMQRAGLEWAYRLAQEPRRLARRYLVKNTQFAAMVVRELLTRRGSGPGGGAGAGSAGASPRTAANDPPR